MSQVLLNFAIPFNEIIGTGDVDRGYLTRAAIVTTPNGGGASGTITECVDMTAVSAITDNTNAKGFFDGGLNRVYVINVDTLAELQDILDANENLFFTLHLSSDFTDAQILAENINFDGVISAEFETQADAKTFAASHCAGLSTQETKGEGVCYALGSLLSANGWSDQQYIKYGGSSSIETVSSIGAAESLFDDRITFWINDEKEGVHLSFFGNGGEAITQRYIAEDLKISLQSQALSYISRNQPMNTLLMRVAVQNELNAVIGDYEDLQYLDPEKDNTITVTKSLDKFFVNAALTVNYSEPVWRMAVTATKGA